MSGTLLSAGAKGFCDSLGVPTESIGWLLTWAPIGVRTVFEASFDTYNDKRLASLSNEADGESETQKDEFGAKRVTLDIIMGGGKGFLIGGAQVVAAYGAGRVIGACAYYVPKFLDQVF